MKAQTEIRLTAIKKLKMIDFMKSSLEINTQINDIVKDAKGCKELCNFCKRKCEHKPHDQNSLEHSCEHFGHQIRVFSDGCYEGPNGKFPSLRVCDEIDGNTKI